MTNPILTSEIETTEKQWRSIYFLGGVMTIIALVGILLDVIMGNVTGGNLSALPQTAIDRFAELHDNSLLGLYNLDLLNIINQIILIPAYFAIYAAHRKVNNAYAAFALIIFLVGTIIFVATNTALPMLELSNKYSASTSETQKSFLAAAGEAMLARGTHGSLGVFIGFTLPNIAGIIMSFVMLRGKVFSKVNSYLGIAGSSLILIYLIMVTFVPATKNMATALAMPGGLMAMAWMILYSIRLFSLGRETDK
jgi:hypothetical protein